MSAPLVFPPSLRWLERPALVRDQGLAGHVTAVLFWRLGCDACHEAAAELARSVVAHGDRPFAVVAVQVPTNAAERDEARQRRAAEALPFASCVDERREFATAAKVTALPFVLLLAADGDVVFRGAGVPQRARLQEAVEALLATAEHDGIAALVPFAPLAPAIERLRPRALAVDGDRLWLAAGHAVYELDVAAALAPRTSDGEAAAAATGEAWIDGAARVPPLASPRLVQRFGGEVAGSDDGRATAARFVAPAGLLVLPDHVLVADAVGHTLRALDRRSGYVETWSGTGRLSADRTGGAYARDQGLCSPHGLLWHDGTVVVAQALAHQLWQFDPATRAAAAWLGSGERTASHAGDLVFDAPRSAALVGETLLVADAGANAIVAVDLAHQRGRVRWAGVPRPTAVLAHGERVFVAASFAGEVLVADAGDEAAPLRVFRGRTHGLVEPVALAAAGTTLWIADAGADAVFVVDLLHDEAPLVRLAWPPAKGTSDSSLAARDAGRGANDASTAAANSPAQEPSFAPLARVTASAPSLARLVGEQRIAAHSDVDLCVHLPPEQADDGVVWQVDVVDEGEPRLAVARHASVVAKSGALALLLPIDAPGRGVLRVRAASERCVLRFVVPIDVVADGAVRLEVR